jgi:hypothetical protein
MWVVVAGLLRHMSGWDENLMLVEDQFKRRLRSGMERAAPGILGEMKMQCTGQGQRCIVGSEFTRLRIWGSKTNQARSRRVPDAKVACDSSTPSHCQNFALACASSRAPDLTKTLAISDIWGSLKEQSRCSGESCSPSRRLALTPASTKETATLYLPALHAFRRGVSPYWSQVLTSIAPVARSHLTLSSFPNAHASENFLEHGRTGSAQLKLRNETAR